MLILPPDRKRSTDEDAPATYVPPPPVSLVYGPPSPASDATAARVAARKASGPSHRMVRTTATARPSLRQARVDAEAVPTAAVSVYVPKGETPYAYAKAERDLSKAADAFLRSAKSRRMGDVNGRTRAQRRNARAKYDDPGYRPNDNRPTC